GGGHHGGDGPGDGGGVGPLGEDAHPVLGGPGHGEVGQVHGVDDAAVVQVVLDLPGGHHGAVVLALGGGGPQVGDGHHALDGGGLAVGEVGDVGGALAAGQSGLHGGGVHQLPTGQVHDAHPVLHGG